MMQAETSLFREGKNFTVSSEEELNVPSYIGATGWFGAR
jgi:hypothetical protein